MTDQSVRFMPNGVLKATCLCWKLSAILSSTDQMPDVNGFVPRCFYSSVLSNNITGCLRSRGSLDLVFSLTRGFLSVGVNWVVKAVNDLALQKEGQWFNPPFFIMQFSFSPYCESMVLWFYSHSPKRSLEIG